MEGHQWLGKPSNYLQMLEKLTQLLFLCIWKLLLECWLSTEWAITYKYLYMERRRPKLEWDGNHRKKLMGNDFSLRCPVKPLIEWVRYTSIEPLCRERKRGCLRTILRFGVPFCLIVPHHTDLKCSSISHQRWWSWWKKVVVISLNFHQSAQNNFPAIEEAWLKISNQ